MKKYSKKCDCARIDDRTTKHKYDTSTKFARSDYKEIHNDRFAISEWVKRIMWNIPCKGRDYTAAQNQLILACLLQNIIQLENTKDTYY